MQQLSIPVVVTPAEVMRKKSLGQSIDLCLELAGLEPKQVQTALKLDKAQFSRWQSGQEGVNWPRLTAVMDHCGNDAPLLWMNHDRGFDLHAMRKVESALERELRQVRSERDSLMNLLLGSRA
ncbi:MAG: hypothetical protein U1C04_18810 [Hydrogenophaga sp.]|uniref:hypothetical protein n=1 Tax=Hydrogenophaga sp. TaxID=1904254 RepID=UPI002ABA5E80|nr:hypothetical protein [Hydrogenophaga sp.]MDZ4282802.1 hypothetical protein [Hydrogenophaga sp.]